jgi:hypothetical protein
MHHVLVKRFSVALSTLLVIAAFAFALLVRG